MDVQKENQNGSVEETDKIKNNTDAPAQIHSNNEEFNTTDENFDFLKHTQTEEDNKPKEKNLFGRRKVSMNS